MSSTEFITFLLEIAATILGLICVALTVRQHIACWPTGLAMVTLLIFVYHQRKLYSDMLLQVVYIFMQIYGWYAWLRGGPQKSELPVTVLPLSYSVFWIVACAATTVVWGASMNRYTDAALPYADAFTTVASLIAQWLMGRKKLQSWLVWIVADVVYIGVHLAKELYFLTGLYCVFLILATMGYFAWKKSLDSEPAPV